MALLNLSAFSDPFFLIALTIFVGYFSEYLARKHYISKALSLMIFGLLLGPILGVVDVGEDSLIRSFYAFLSTLALIILLFDGGISLNIYEVFKGLRKATLFTLTSFLLSVLFTTILAFTTSYSLLEAITIGVLLGGTSSVIVIAVIEKLSNITEETRSLLVIESVLTDSLIIILVFLLIDFYLSSELSLQDAFRNIITTVVMSSFVGAVFAFLWVKLIEERVFKHFYYITTLGVLFLLYSVANFLGVNGGLAVFVFALVFSNMKNLTPATGEYFLHYLLGEKRIKDLQAEITFFIQTFFFVYMGLLFPLEYVSADVIVISILLTALYLLARYLSYKLVLEKEKDKYDPNIIIPMMARGLAAAIMVGVLLEKGIYIKDLFTIAFSVIFLTNLVSTLYIYYYAKRAKGAPEEESEEEGAKA